MENPNVIDKKKVDTVPNSKSKTKADNGCQREHNKKLSTKTTTKKPYSFDELYGIRDSMKSFDAISFDNMDALLKKSDEKVPTKRSNERKHGKQFENNCERPKRANDNYNRDRVTKEQNRIILGPQRRSFNSGCFVPVSTTNCATTASSSQNPFNSTTIDSSNNNSSSTTTTSSRSNTSRRIGSGRMFCAETDSNSVQFESNLVTSSTNSNSSNTNPNQRSKNTNSTSDDKLDKRVFIRDFEKQSNRSGGSTATNRYGVHNPNQDWRSGAKDSHRNRYGTKSGGIEDEPEWFSGGPTSQFDTIELRGFDDSSEEHPIEEDKIMAEHESESEFEGSTVSVPGPVAKTQTDVINTQDSEHEGDNGGCRGGVVNKVLSILQCDSISELLKINSIDDKGEKNSGSKFSKWFQTKSNSSDTAATDPKSTYPNSVPEKNVVHGGDHNNVRKQESFPYRNSSWGDNLVNDILNENNADELVAKKLTPNDIIEFMKVDLKSDDKIREVNSKAIPLEELERKIRSSLQSRNDNCDTVLDYSRDNMATSLHQPRINVPHVPTDLVMKLHHIQQQQEMMSMMQQQNLMPNIDTSSAPNITAIPPISGAFSSTSSHQQLLNEIYDSSEASSVFFGLKNGVISMESIYHHLSHSNLSRSYRDMLISILRVHNAQQQKNDDLLHNFQQIQQQQQQHVRQSNSTNMSQNMLHKKMLIKKADDQMQQQLKQQYHPNANYHQPQQQQQPQPQLHLSNPNKNLAFTPTSVLRKMVADKDSDSVLSSPLLSRSNTPTVDKLKECPNMFSNIVGDKSSSYTPFATTVSSANVNQLPFTDHSKNDVHGNPYHNQWSSNKDVRSQHYPEQYNKVLDHQMIRKHNNVHMNQQVPLGNLPLGNQPVGNSSTPSSMFFENLLQLRQPLCQTQTQAQTQSQTLSSQHYQNQNYYPNVGHHRQQQFQLPPQPPHHQNPSVLAQQQSMFLTRNFHNT